MSDSPRYEITDLLDGRIELRRNGMVMSHHRTWQEAEQAARQIDAEVAHSGWSMPSMTEPMALDAKAPEAARTTGGQDELRQKNVAETSRLIADALAKASPVLGGPEGDSILAYSIPSGLWLMLQASVRNLLDKLAALPPPAAGEGLEPGQSLSFGEASKAILALMDDFRSRAPFGYHEPGSPYPSYKTPLILHSDDIGRLLDKLLDAAMWTDRAERRRASSTPAARAAVVEEAASVVEAFILPESGPDYGMMSDATRYVTRKTNRLYQQLAHEIRALKEKT